MKVRIGVGAAGASSSTEAMAELVTGLDELGFDSLWLSEVLTGPVLDPVVGLAWAAASNPRLKVGTTMLLPGRNVLRLAKQLASLDVLCKGRLLVTLVPGLTYRAGARGHRRRSEAARRLHRRGAAAAAPALGGRDGEPRGRRRPLPGRQALAAARAAAARGVAGRQRAGRARALRPAVGWLAAVAVHARRGGGGRVGDRGARRRGPGARSAPSTSA